MSEKEESKQSSTKTTKAEEKSKSETPKANVKKDKKVKETKSKTEKKNKTTKKATKPEKKVKATKKPTKKETKPATKKTTTKKSNSDLTNYESHVIEAIKSKATEDNEWVGFNSITAYIRQYIPDVKLGNLPTLARNAADRLYQRGILKHKKSSYAIAKKGKSIEIDAPKRKTVRPPLAKGQKRALTEEKTEKYLTVTSSNRVSTRNIIV